MPRGDASFFSSLLSSLLYIIAIMFQRGSENPKVDLVVFSKDLPINPTISENSKEKICAENFLAKKSKSSE